MDWRRLLTAPAWGNLTHAVDNGEKVPPATCRFLRIPLERAEPVIRRTMGLSSLPSLLALVGLGGFLVVQALLGSGLTGVLGS